MKLAVIETKQTKSPKKKFPTVHIFYSILNKQNKKYIYIYTYI